MIEILQEKTTGLHPHTYYIDKKSGKMVAYKKALTGLEMFTDQENGVEIFNVPKSFSKRYRKFDKLGVIDSIDLIEKYNEEMC